MRGRGWILGLLAGGLALAPAASAASLPTVRSGERPGPPRLYAPAPKLPQLANRAPFRAKPLLVSGTDGLRNGEYVYQDYLFDDRGADTVPGSGNRNPGSDIASPTAGDAFYPTADRFAGNAADLVEFRVRPEADALVYRITLNSVKDDDASVVAIGVDTDRGGSAPVAWPRGAGLRTSGVDHFITAWGTGGEVTDYGADGGPTRTTALPRGAVSMDRRSNQLTVRVPRSRMNPGTATWRYVAGAGLWSGTGFVPVPARSEPTASEPASGDPTEDAPAVFNLAFRFDEPQIKANVPAFGTLDDVLRGQRGPLGEVLPPTTTVTQPGGGPSATVSDYETFPGVGNWHEDKQSRALKNRTSGGFHADVDFAKLAAAVREAPHPPGRRQARILASNVELPEGVREDFPRYGGRLQPYHLTVPPTYRGDPVGLTFALHSLGGNHNQYAVFSPNQLRQFGDERNQLVATPLAHGTDGWYQDEAEADVFEVWRDVARNFRLTPEKVALTGYSMGGYGTYRLGAEYPDLFGRAFTAVGPPARGIWPAPGDACAGRTFCDPPPMKDTGGPGHDANSNPKLENLRSIPFMNWVEAADQLVPYPGPRAQQTRFDALGLRSQLWTFSPGEHFTLAILDEWGPARDFLGEARVTRDPARVDYAFLPDADRRRLGLVHDHAYWLSDLSVRSRAGDPGRRPARGEVSARSFARGEGTPQTRRIDSAGSLPPSAYRIEGTEWTGVPTVARRNALSLRLENVGRGRVDGRRARLRGDRALRVTVRSDGRGRIRLDLPFGPGTRVTRVQGGAVSAARGRARTAAAAPEVRLDRRGASIRVGSGTRTYIFSPARRGASQPRFTG